MQALTIMTFGFAYTFASDFCSRQTNWERCRVVLSLWRYKTRTEDGENTALHNADACGIGGYI